MFVKICGLTNIEDAKAAQDLGADKLGFIFYSKSKRAITIKDCQKLTGMLSSGTNKVGVFVNEEISQILETVKVCGLSAVQLHGEESPNYIVELKQKLQILSQPIELIKAISAPLSEGSFSVDYLLVDAPPSKDQLGGQGIKSDWNLAKELAKSYPIILAGGLNPQNILEVFDEFSPQGLDICSGVEKEPGLKDPKKLEELFQVLKGYSKSQI